MFSKDSKNNNAAPEPTAALAADIARRSNGHATQSIISRDLKIKGDLVCSGDIQIDGEVEGARVGEPGRHSSAFAAAASLRDLGASYEVTERAVLLGAGKCSPPLGEYEAKRCVRNAFAK
jgi:hypothetical protein